VFKRAQKLVFQISPNPFSKLTYINFGKVQGVKSIELKIYDAAGRVVKDIPHLTLDALRRLAGMVQTMLIKDFPAVYIS
jgi:hypothetical protein